MAWIKLGVEKIEDAGKETTEHIELEGVLFLSEDGKEKRYNIKAMIPQATQYFRKEFPEYDWDESKPHIAVVLGEEIK